MRTALAVVLAAGEGKRMRSARPKVLHDVAGLPMLAHVLATLRRADVGRVAVVVGPGHDAVASLARSSGIASDRETSVHVQSERRGTAHAVLAARDALATPTDDLIVLYGDTPFVSADTIARLRAELAGGAAVAVAGFRTADPHGFGRLLVEAGRLAAIREERDASEAERRIDFCNAGIMALAGSQALSVLDAIGDRNVQGEFYLTDAVEIANGRGSQVTAIEIPAEEAFGVNDRIQLAEAERMFQARRRIEAMRDGATLVSPDTVVFSHDTRLGRDVTIEPNVVFGPGVTVGDSVVIRAFSHLEGASVGAGATVGPFARLRPGAAIGEGVHIGNFVEIKQASVEAGAKINHLAYVGDARVGARANVGAGAITCNYDGVTKSRTDIGAGAFIGSNASLVAPVTIGDGAYVASGSVITEDVEADALALGRARQVVKPGRAAKYRKR